MEKFYVNSKDIDKICKLVKTYGVCVIKNYTGNINLLNREFSDVLSKYKNLLDKLKYNRCLRTNVNSNIVNNNTYPNINTLFTSLFIKNISNNILGKWKYNNIFIHEDFQNEVTNNVYPHFDYDRQLKFYLCLNDMGLENGCFKTLPGSLELTAKKRKINKRKNIFTPGHKFYNGTIIKREQLISVIAEAGDLIIFDTNCIHCGGDKFKNGKNRRVMRLHIKKK